ncbi:MAG: T9SS type A sorting domain-containing protein [Bacteroidetes bacterium]|nr:T9SS type A sorting domain-containing protein [Bacteroidota bacterium]
MKKMILLFCLALIPAIGFTQAVYPGNGNSGFGGVLGTGAFSINDNGTTVTITFAKGSGSFNDAIVIYIDSDNSRNFPFTATFTDEGDNLRKGISGRNGGSNSLLFFPGTLTADYAVAFAPTQGFGGLWQLETGSHTFVATANLSSTTVTDPVFTVSFTWASIGLTGAPGDNFKFIATYLNPTNAFRSDEAIGDASFSGNPGTGPIAFTGFRSYYQGGYDTPLPIELLTWTATPGDNKVTLNWETASELNHAGFEILRSTKKDGVFQAIASYRNEESLRPKGETGAKYSLVDNRKVYNGLTYFYKLVDVALDGNRTEHAVISAIPTDGKPAQPGFETPAEFALKGLYPNPFNPNGNLEFSLPKKGFVSIELYNVIGQKVATAFEGVLEGGRNHTNRIEISGNGLPSGVYLAVVNFSGQRLTSKFTLLK